MKRKNILWYLGIVIASVLLAFGIFLRNWPLSLVGFAIALILKATNKYIPLPQIYRDMGIDNEVFEGRAKQNDEENNE
ncbi:MAG: hypothetical protein Q4C52_09160 [Eubacteriales bacterium]|nr:hypothetical protein [Eubacteriales bacterium]